MGNRLDRNFINHSSLINKDDASKPRAKGLPRFLFAPLFLLVFGLPAAIAWATNTGAAGFAFFLVLSFLLPQVRHIFTPKESTNWPTIQGVIEESYILADRDGGYSPRVKYTYQVNGSGTLRLY